MDQVVDAHLQTVLQVQPHGPYHFIGYSLGGTLAQGIAARLQARGEQVAFLGLLDTYPPETQNWDVMLDDNVLKEVQREREQFPAVSQDTLDPALGETRTAMFDNIEANYADSVRLLSHTRTARFRGRATLFVAKRTLQEGMDVQQTVAVRRCAAGARAGLRACRYRFAGVVQSAGAAAEPDLAHAVIAPVISPPGTGNYPRVAAFLRLLTVEYQ